jgi:hypothetical protein
VDRRLQTCFVGGVLSTRSAWVIGGLSFWLGLEPGRKLLLPLGLLWCYHEHMNKSSRVNMKTPKKRAAATGDLVGVRVQPDMAKQLDDWRRKQEDLPGRPEAIRRLVELGLKVKK